MAILTPGVRAIPFAVPNFVSITVSHAKATAPLSDLEPEVLAILCDEFREAVFAKAGKSDPEKGRR